MFPSFHPLETSIVAPITPPGEGGVAILRLTGPDAFLLAQPLCSRSLDACPSHTLTRCRFGAVGQESLDVGLVAVMRAPNTYTGQNAVELHVHGNPHIVEALTRLLVERGALLALPGEFTYRAYMLGKLDLAQAESVSTLIHAKGERAIKLAKRQLEGELSQRIDQLKSPLVELAAQLEAQLDFPDDVPPTMSPQLHFEVLSSCRDQLKRLEEGYQRETLLREGFSICLLGRPNVGKSSLLNALLRRDRAIVTPIPGTTRDLIEAPLRLGGVQIKLIDTAGIREGDEVDLVEREGVRRTWDAWKRADATLFILDATGGITSDDRSLFKRIDPEKTLIVWNKVDLAPPPSIDGLGLQMMASSANSAPPQLEVAISAQTGQGIEQLEERLAAFVGQRGPSDPHEVALIHQRHETHVRAARANLDRALADPITDETSDLLATNVRAAIDQLEGIKGGNATEDLLSAIFSTFCLGK